MNLFTFDYIVIDSTLPYSAIDIFYFLDHFQRFGIQVFICDFLNLIQKLKPIGFYHVRFPTFGGYLITHTSLHEFD